VKPDALMLELCKERVELLMPEKALDQGDPTLAWHAEGAAVEGLPSGPGWPTQEELLSVVRTASGGPLLPPVHIEEDMRALLRTGLFGAVTFRPSQSSPLAVPSFIVPPGATRPQTALPMGAITFDVRPRNLPPIKSVSVTLAGALAAGPAQSAADALAAAVPSAPGASLDRLLELRVRLLDAVGRPATVVFDGVETGDVVATVTEGAAASPSTGLEHGAEAAPGKWGIGISPPPAVAPPQVVGRAQPAAASVPVVRRGSRGRPGYTVREHERGAAGQAPPPAGEDASLAGKLSLAMTREYAKYQSAAGEALGVQGGEVWQVAMEEALACGAGIVVLGDRPTDITRDRLARGVLSALAGPALGAAALVAGAGAAAAMGALDAAPALAGVGAGVALGAGLVVLPVLGPINEVKALSQLPSKEAIEDAVAIKTPLHANPETTKLWGEDALIDWPGALAPVITERDEFMAKSVACLAKGEAGVSPALVATRTEGGGTAVEYVVPKGSEGLASCPQGAGKGAFEPAAGAKPRCVVAVVGTAHVGGMIRGWEAALSSSGDVSRLL